jgi:FkbM family methyltransferase
MFRLAENNDDTRFERNGERFLLRSVLSAGRGAESGKPPAVIFDVGANKGEYTRAVLELAVQLRTPVEMHLFEPSPSCLATLTARFGRAANVRIVACATGEQSGSVTLHHGGTGSSHASLLRRPELVQDPGADVVVPVRRLDDYLRSSGVQRIALLKLDVEGFELATLRGLGDRMSPDIIDVIQFEYGGTTRDAGVTLRELAHLVHERGFLLGKLLPRSIELRNYAPWMENFAYANYVALAPHWLAARR